MLREAGVLDEDEGGTAVARAAVVGIGSADAAGDHGQGVAVDLVEWELGFGKLWDAVVLAEHSEHEGGALNMDRDLAGFVRPGPEPGLGFVGFGAEDLNLPAVRIPEGQQSRCDIQVPSQIADHAFKMELIGKDGNSSATKQVSHRRKMLRV